MRRHLWILVLAVLALASPASATILGYANVAWDGIHFNDTGYVNTSFGGWYYSPPYQADVTITQLYGQVLDPFLVLRDQPLFCIELQQTAGSGSAFSIRDLADAPRPGAGIPMGADKATLLRKLWKVHSADALAGDDHGGAADPIASEAFAISVWEIVFEGSGNPLDVRKNDPNNPNNPNPNRGLFYLNGATNRSWADHVTAVWDRATSYLADAVATDLSHLPSLYALSDPNRQDQIFLGELPPPDNETHNEVPEPTTIAQLLGLGLMGLIGYRRFRRARAA